MHLISVDSGRKGGAAWWIAKTLVATALVELDATGRLLYRKSLGSNLRPIYGADGPTCVTITELPVYRTQGGKGTPASDSIIQAYRGGLLAAALGGFGPHEQVLPHQWKGQLTKATCWSRVQRRLTAAELALVVDDDNVQDAVGIGLWRLGRMGHDFS